MRTVSIKFRGEQRDVQYRDCGWEPDTNAHEIDWDFVGPPVANLTAEEELSVMDQLYAIVNDPHHNDEDFLDT